MRACVCVCVHARVCMRVCIYTYTCMCVHVWVCVHLCVWCVCV